MRVDKLPHIWCAGCGDGSVTAALIRAIDKLKIQRDDVAVITGIGCSSRVNNILDFNTFQTLHGRAVAYASGFKMAKPQMKVIVVTGDGDGAGIGGNHLIHAARRNIDLTVILINNKIFGMTGGQFSPLTPYGAVASTAIYETIEYPFDVCKLMEASGATYVARGTVYHLSLTEKLIAQALEHKGFSFVEVITQCPTGFGKRNKMPDPYDLLMWQKENSVHVDQVGKYSAEELKNKHIIGELFVSNDRMEFTEAYEQLKERARLSAKGGGNK
ncbi:MAG: 2-oxoacid:ferredoxin oxidoreductase subunit beta [Bacteroidales bacterium]|nr:2-oxoacid:ferredoxin oxidoreductase subunit beta [Bacteroidales bacterium]